MNVRDLFESLNFKDIYVLQDIRMKISAFSYALASSKAIAETLKGCYKCYWRMMPHTQLQAIRIVMNFIDSMKKVFVTVLVMLRRNCGSEQVSVHKK